jgi:hypothetical protein
MLTDYFYNECIRKTVIAFGTLFNNIEVRKYKTNGKVDYIKKVPLAYSGRQKFLERLIDNPDLNKKTQTTSPRMGFEMAGIYYDSSRKGSIVQKYSKSYTTSRRTDTQYLPVPYNIDFNLYIYSKTNDDILQIIEQIVPFFQPAFNVTLNMIPDMDEIKDIPYILNTIDIDDNYETEFEDTRVIVYTLSFTAKSYIYGIVNNDIGGLINTVNIQYFSGVGSTTPTRIKKYTVIPNPVNANPLGDFGFTTTVEEP